MTLPTCYAVLRRLRKWIVNGSMPHAYDILRIIFLLPVRKRYSHLWSVNFFFSSGA